MPDEGSGGGSGGFECPPCKLLLCSGGEVAGGAASLVQYAQAYGAVVLQRSLMGRAVSKELKDRHAKILERQGDTLAEMQGELEEMAREVGGL